MHYKYTHIHEEVEQENLRWWSRQDEWKASNDETILEVIKTLYKQKFRKEN